MAISEDLLELLVCPKCKGSLALASDGSSLDCAACKLSYPVKDDIPVLLVDEAAQLGGSTGS